MPLDPDDPTLMRVIATSAHELDQLQASTQRDLLAIYTRERDLIVAKIISQGSADTFGMRHLRVIVKALDVSIERLQQDLGVALTDGINRAGGLGATQGARELATLESTFGDRSTAKIIASITGKIPHRAMASILELATIQTEHLTLDLSQTVKAVLHQGLITGLNSRQLVPALARQVGNVADSKAWMLERTLRTGLNAAVNQGHSATYAEAKKQYLPDLKRQGHETLYAGGVAQRRGKGGKGKRRVNHPFSPFLHGAVTELDQPWRIASPDFPVMFWTRDGGDYVGNSYPAHLYERGRQVPYREAWQSEASAHLERLAEAERQRLLTAATGRP